MGNEHKKKRSYQEIKTAFERISNGSLPKNFESTLSKAYLLFLGGYNPENYPSSDFAANSLKDFVKYSHLLSHRRKIDIAGGTREVALEDEAFNSLNLSQRIARNLICPFFKKRNQISNKIFNDIHFLGLSYVHAIVNGVADGFINPSLAYESKLNAIDIAKKGLRAYDSYKNNGFNKDTEIALDNLENSLEHASISLLRRFELVPTSGKHIYKENECIEILKEKILKEIDLFLPDTIIPIAHGGTEVGLKLSNFLEDQGKFVITYPLFYSIKTRNHRFPWIEYDSEFLKSNSLGEKNSLVTEDWVTTGNTLKGILLQLEQNSPKEIRIATIKKDKEKSKNLSFLEKYFFYTGTDCIYKGDKTDSLD